MSYKDVLIDTILATDAVKKARFAGFDGAHCGAGEAALGVFKEDNDSGEYAAVTVYGTPLVESGGQFAVGDDIVSDSTGRAVKAADLSVSSAMTISVSVPSGATPVTSTGAQPTLTASSSAANTLTGGALPQKVLGRAMRASSGAGKFAKVLLR